VVSENPAKKKEKVNTFSDGEIIQECLETAADAAFLDEK
jgi:hypothetical protein